jgi:O-antigen/teichoic acid export membrane protein
MFNIIKNVAKHSVIYGLSDMLSRAIGFIMIPIYTTYLKPADYGTLELLDLTSYIIGLFLAMGIAQSVVRFYYEYKEPEKRNQMISVAMITLWIISAVTLVILFMLSDKVSVLVFQSADYSKYFKIIFITTVIGLSNEIPLTLLRIEEKSITYVSISLSKLVINLTLNIVFIVKYNLGVQGILYSGLITGTLLGITMLTVILRRLRMRLSYSFSMLKAMFAYGFPLVWNWLGLFVLNFGDRFFLQRFAGLNDVGIYSLAYKFGMLPNVLILSPFLMIWAPKRFDLLKEPNAKEIYSNVFTYFMFLQIFVGMGIVILIKDTIHIVSEPNYWSAWIYVLPILLAYNINGMYLYVQFGIHLKNQTKHLAYASLLAALVNIAGNFILIPIIKIWGAAITTFLSFAFLMAYVYFPSQKLYHISYQWNRIVHMLGVAVALYLISYFIPLKSPSLLLIIKFFIALTFPFILLATKFYTTQELNKIKSIINAIRNRLWRRKDEQPLQIG